MDQKTLQLLHDTKWYLDRLKEVLDLFLGSYFSYFAFNVNIRGKPIYLLYSFILMLIIFTFKFIIIMLICYVTMKLSWQTCLLISAIVAYTELQRTQCKGLHLDPVSLIPHGLYTCCCWLDWHFWHTHQTRKHISNPVAHRFQEKCCSTQKPLQNVGHQVYSVEPGHCVWEFSI